MTAQPLPELEPYTDFDCEYTPVNAKRMIEYIKRRKENNVLQPVIHVDYWEFVEYKLAIADRLEEIDSMLFDARITANRVDMNDKLDATKLKLVQFIAELTAKTQSESKIQRGKTQ